MNNSERLDSIERIRVILQQQVDALGGLLSTATTAQQQLQLLEQTHKVQLIPYTVMKPKRKGIAERKSAIKARSEFNPAKHYWAYILKDGKMSFHGTDVMDMSSARGVRNQSDSWLDKIEYDCFYTKGCICLHLTSTTDVKTRDFALLFQCLGAQFWNKQFVVK